MKRSRRDLLTAWTGVELERSARHSGCANLPKALLVFVRPRKCRSATNRHAPCRPSVIDRKVTNWQRSQWGADLFGSGDW